MAPCPIRILIHGVSHVNVEVRDVAKARRVYGGTLGFAEKASGEGWVDFDAGGTVLVRLLETARPAQRASLRVQAAEVDTAYKALVSAGCAAVYAPARTPEQEHVATVRDPDGNTIQLWRALTEDEYDFVPELPKVLTWTPDAEALLKSLLKAVPALFRGLARQRVSAVAEELAAPTRLVTKEEVVRGFILASPKITRGRNRQPLIDHGIDVEKYRADWDSE